MKKQNVVITLRRCVCIVEEQNTTQQVYMNIIFSFIFYSNAEISSEHQRY